MTFHLKTCPNIANVKSVPEAPEVRTSPGVPKKSGIHKKTRDAANLF